MMSFVPVLQAAVLIVRSWLEQLHQEGVEGATDTDSTAACCLWAKAVMSSRTERTLLTCEANPLQTPLVIETYVTG